MLSALRTSITIPLTPSVPPGQDASLTYAETSPPDRICNLQLCYPLCSFHEVSTAPRSLFANMRDEARDGGEKERRMQIRGLSPPWELPPARALSTSNACQSTLPYSAPYLPITHPNAPLGAGLCIFNKFRESSWPAISAGGCSEGGFRLPRKRCPRVYLCARSSQSSTALLPSTPILAIPSPPFSALRAAPPISHSLSLFLLSFSRFLFLFLPLPRARRIFFSPASVQLAFHRSSSSLSSFSASLAPPRSPLTPAPLFLARFISARCQFEFGTRATGQRVSTKNQFLNARLFRAEKPACILPPPPFLPFFPHFFVPLLLRFFRRNDDTEASSSG